MKQAGMETLLNSRAGGGGYSTWFYTGRLYPKGQPVYKVPRSYTFYWKMVLHLSDVSLEGYIQDFNWCKCTVF